jgi:hypothetical protein
MHSRPCISPDFNHLPSASLPGWLAKRKRQQRYSNHQKRLSQLEAPAGVLKTKEFPWVHSMCLPAGWFGRHLCELNNLRSMNWRRCYNNEKSLDLIVSRAKAEARLRRKSATAKPVAAKDSSDPALIMAIAECRGCPGYGKFWIENKLGSLNEFKAALAANSQRIQGLFGNHPVR